MKKILLSLTLFLLSINMMAQSNEYEKCTRELLEIGTSNYSPKQMKETMKATLKTVADQLNGLLGQLGVANANQMPDMTGMLSGMFDEVLGDYFDNGEFTKDMVSILTPVYERQLSLDEMKQVLKLYRSERGQRVLASTAKQADQIGDATSKLIQDITAMATGGEMPTPARVDCPEDYRQLFDKYYEMTTAPQIQKSLEKLGNVPNAQNMKKYMTEAMPERILSIVYPAMSKEELKEAIDFFGEPQIKRFAEAGTNINEAELKPLNDKLNTNLQKYLSKFLPGM